jgi:hypothetical protein
MTNRITAASNASALAPPGIVASALEYQHDVKGSYPIPAGDAVIDSAIGLAITAVPASGPFSSRLHGWAKNVLYAMAAVAAYWPRPHRATSRQRKASRSAVSPAASSASSSAA